MKILIAEDNFISRRMLKEILSPYGDCDIVVNGSEAIQAFRLAMDEKKPYQLICMDIMMPTVDGHKALEKIRTMEKDMAIPESEHTKVIVISALDDPKNVVKAYKDGMADTYIVKPIRKEKVLNELQKLGFVTL